MNTDVYAFVTLGDSFSEGLEDERGPDGRHRGWADRVADGLTQRTGQLQYANLAVRGRLLAQVVDQQLPLALQLLDDAEVRQGALVSFHAGGNDLLRPGRDAGVIAEQYAAAVAALVHAGVTPLLFTVLERAGGTSRAAAALARRFATFNERVRATAAEHPAVLVDLAALPVLQDRRMWHADRLHLNPDGHARVAAAARNALGHAGEEAHHSWAAELPPERRRRTADVMTDARWLVQHLSPWVLRRLRGVSSGDGIDPKHPQLMLRKHLPTPRT